MRVTIRAEGKIARTGETIDRLYRGRINRGNFAVKGMEALRLLCRPYRNSLIILVGFDSGKLYCSQRHRVFYHARKRYVHVASAFPLAHYYRAVLSWGP